MTGASRLVKKAGLLCLLVSVVVILVSVAARAAVTEDAKRDFNRGVEFSKAGSVDSAIAAYEAATTASPDYLQAHINVGALYYEKKQYDLAAKHLKAAIALDSTSADAYRNLGLVHIEAQEFDNARAAFSRLSKLDPKMAATAWASLAQALKKKGDVPGALDAYSQAVAADPKDYRSHYNIGNIQLQANRLDEAMASYKKAIAQNPKYVEAYYNLAIASNKQNEASCVPDYEAFLKAATGNPKWKAQIKAAQDKVKEIKDKAASGN